ncbi:Mpp10 protein [Histomonas meleagridis]|uniref:Mpp10 protein n=1 Tax=Histomonas meleagridis TaxID=135588 RepID=UPI00355A125D|nr:Mpp10 protein [Histomonas meleagridis]KAH0802383.1 Mpp10 protein [Histomonas meleagridis]
MLDRLDAISKTPSILINGDSTLSNLFMDMTISFFKVTKDNEFQPNSAGPIENLVHNKEFGEWETWEQIRVQNEALIAAASKVNFNEDLAQEEEELNEAPSGGERGPLIYEEEEEEANDFPLNLQNEGEEEEEEANEEFSRILMGADDDSDYSKPINYKDFYGDEPPDDVSSARKKQVEAIEQSLISKRPWELNGETLASERPVDSLAEVELDFDFTSNRAPIPPPTADIEAILLSRIESMNFDDVTRKQKPQLRASEIREINSSKPKSSLVDEYVNDYIQRAQNSGDNSGEVEYTAEERKAIDLFESVMSELNRFTEKNYIARRPRAHVDVSKGVTVDVEERPQNQLAPEEIMAPVGSTRQMKGELERTHEEHRAHRRVKKEKQKKEKEARDAAKGILYSQTGRDGAEVKAQQDVKKLLSGNLQGVEVVAAGGAISDEKQNKHKKEDHRFML